MDGCIRGAMVCPICDWRTMGRWNGTTIRPWNQWGRWRAARVPMGTDMAGNVCEWTGRLVWEEPPRRVPVRENSIALWCWILGPISFGRWCQDPTFRVEDSRNATVM